MNASVNSEVDITYNNDRIGVNEEIDRTISSACKHKFENNGGICEQITEDLFVFLYGTHNILFIPPTPKVSD